MDDLGVWEYDLDVLVPIQSVHCQTILSLLLLQMKTRTFMLRTGDAGRSRRYAQYAS